MKISKMFVFAVISAVLISCGTVKPESDPFKDAVKQALNAFSNRDTAAIKLMTDKETGLFIVYRIGTADTYSAVPSIDFSDSLNGSMAMMKFEMDTNLKYEKLPEYSCETNKWSKAGLFCDTTLTDHLLSQTALNMNTYFEANIPQSEIDKFKGIENVSRRIVLTDNKGGEIVFYLSYIRSKWCITIIDRVSSDCSA